MGAEEIHWGFSEINDLDLLHSKLNMATKLNHKNGDKTMSEDLLIEKEDKIGKLEFRYQQLYSQTYCTNWERYITRPEYIILKSHK